MLESRTLPWNLHELTLVLSCWAILAYPWEKLFHGFKSTRNFAPPKNVRKKNCYLVLSFFLLLLLFIGRSSTKSDPCRLQIPLEFVSLLSGWLFMTGVAGKSTFAGSWLTLAWRGIPTFPVVLCQGGNFCRPLVVGFG